MTPWQKSQKHFPVYNKHIYSLHVPSMCSFRSVSCECADADLVNLIFLRFSTHINAYSRDFWPIRLNEPNKCLYLFQRISVNRKPNKWLNR